MVKCIAQKEPVSLKTMYAFQKHDAGTNTVEVEKKLNNIDETDLKEQNEQMSGFELCRQLRRNPITSKVPIIICSSKNSEIDRLWAMRQGADVYITKPYIREELLQVVQAFTYMGLSKNGRLI